MCEFWLCLLTGMNPRDSTGRTSNNLLSCCYCVSHLYVSRHSLLFLKDFFFFLNFVRKKGQVGWGPGEPDLVGGNPAYSMGVKLSGLGSPFQPNHEDGSLRRNWYRKKAHLQRNTNTSNCVAENYPQKKVICVFATETTMETKQAGSLLTQSRTTKLKREKKNGSAFYSAKYYGWSRQSWQQGEKLPRVGVIEGGGEGRDGVWMQHSPACGRSSSSSRQPMSRAPRYRYDAVLAFSSPVLPSKRRCGCVQQPSSPRVFMHIHLPVFACKRETLPPATSLSPRPPKGSLLCRWGPGLPLCACQRLQEGLASPGQPQH